MAIILQTLFSHAISEQSFVYFDWNFTDVVKVQINNMVILAQIVVWHQTAGKPLSEPNMA